jgi:competence protein ComEC
MFSWHAIPFARVLLPFIGGILFCNFYPLGHTIPAYLLILLFLSAFFFKYVFGHTLQFRLRMLQGLLLSSCILLLGYYRTYWHDDTKQTPHFSNFSHAKFYYLSIEDAVVEKSRFYRCYASINEVCDSTGKLHHAQGSLLLYLNKKAVETKPMIGERYLVKAQTIELNEPANPGEFNFKRYLSYRNIHHQLFTDTANTFKSKNVASSMYRYATIFRDQCLDIIRKHIVSREELGVAEALLLGYKDDLDPQITSAFSRTGTLHVLAVSGMHAGIIFLLISFLTRPLEKRKKGKWVQLALLLAGIWFYAFMTGLSSSVLRASVMFSIMSVGKILKHRVNVYNTLFGSAFILLLYNPFYIFDVGFQLSYLAVLGIVWLQPMISSWLSPRTKLGRYLWDLVSVSLAAQVLTFPISLFYFHQFPNYFLLSNMLIIPLTSFILIGLIFLLAVNWIPLFALWAGKFLFASIWLSNWLVTTIDRLPYSLANGLFIDLFQTVLLYGLIFLSIALIVHRQNWILFSFLSSLLVFTGVYAFKRHTQLGQRAFISYKIKGHDAFTCIEGRKAYIISDSAFLSDSSTFNFSILPHLWEHGIEQLEKVNLDKNFVSTNLMVSKRIGFQFFDNIMTIQKSVLNNVQRQEFILLKKFDKKIFMQCENNHKRFIISSSLTKKETQILKNKYFNIFHKKLEIDKKALVFFY